MIKEQLNQRKLAFQLHDTAQQEKEIFNQTTKMDQKKSNNVNIIYWSSTGRRLGRRTATG